MDFGRLVNVELFVAIYDSMVRSLTATEIKRLEKINYHILVSIAISAKT